MFCRAVVARPLLWSAWHELTKLITDPEEVSNGWEVGWGKVPIVKRARGMEIVNRIWEKRD